MSVRKHGKKVWNKKRIILKYCVAFVVSFQVAFKSWKNEK